MAFPLSQLPIELALEILRLAAFPVQHSDSDRLSIYTTARALALVSHSVRNVIMPHLLQIVILNSHESLTKFVRTLHEQTQLARCRSRLSVDYAQLVHHIWFSRCWESLQQSSASFSVHAYDLLGEVLCRAESLGFTFLSYHLLYEALGGSCSPSTRPWRCQHLTLAGNNPRWNPLISTANGQAFLQQLTRLTMWLPADDTIGPPFTSHLDLGHRVPNWVQRVPFEFMNNLIHFAFSLVNSPRMTTTAVVVYTLPPSLRSQHDSTIFRTWATSTDPLAYGKVVDVNVGITHSPDMEDGNWGTAFLRDDVGANIERLEQ